MSVTYRGLGDSVTLVYELRVADVLTDATVSVTVTKPDGTSTSGSPTRHPSVGRYEHDLGLDQAGLWRYRFAATGAATDAEAGSFFVEAADAPDLYATVGELRRELGARPGQLDDGLLAKAVRAASRSIDLHTHQRFWLDPTATARVFRAEVPHELLTPPFGSTAGLAVRTDEQGSGIWGAAWTLGVDYQVEPLNADANGGAWRWWRLAVVGPLRFPTLPWTNRPGVQVTARWGWSTVPDTIREAAVILAMRYYKRKDTPLGFEGFQDFGAVRITRSDPDIAAMLGSFTIPVFA